MSTPAVPQSTLHLPADIGITQAAALRNEFLKFLKQDADITLEGGETERVHAAGLQLLTALLRGCRAAGHNWQWAEVSPALREAACGMGLAEELKMPALILDADKETGDKESV